MDWLRRVTKKDVGQTPEPAAQQPPEASKPEPPRNELEATVQQAAPVLETARKTEKQLRADALHTMEIMEAARADRGNFCLTLGQGDSRVLLLVEPDKGTTEDRVFHVNYDFANYYLVTSTGVKRLTFSQQQGRQFSPSEKEAVNRQTTFQAILDETVRGGNPNLPNATFEEIKKEDGSTSHYALNLSSPKDPNKRVTIHSTPSSRFYHLIAPSTNEAVDKAVLEKSLAKVQAPVQARIAQARAQIGALGGIRESLK